jgi:DNA-binding HxlR family transcriptional regulator
LLERDGLIRREVKCARQNHVEYFLTPLGADLAKQIMNLIEWIGLQAGAILDARQKFDLEND